MGTTYRRAFAWLLKGTSKRHVRFLESHQKGHDIVREIDRFWGRPHFNMRFVPISGPMFHMSASDIAIVSIANADLASG